jgi:hypothetical protein
MGSKHKPLKNENPGPGQYQSDKVKGIRPVSSYGKIGTTKRSDLFESEKKKMEGMPGPGAHTQSYSSFGNTKNNTHFGSGRKDSRNENPGPGQYNQMGKNLTQQKS